MSEYKTLLIHTSLAVMTVTLSNPPINLETDTMMAEFDWEAFGAMRADEKIPIFLIGICLLFLYRRDPA